MIWKSIGILFLQLKVKELFLILESFIFYLHLNLLLFLQVMLLKWYRLNHQ